MKSMCAAVFGVLGLLVSAPGLAQVAGSTTLGVAVAEMRQVALGWSAKKQILGAEVVNENDEKVGRIDDIIIAPDRSVSYVVIGAGAFVGLGRHDVAIPVDQVEPHDGKVLLRGATKDVIKALPGFEYARK